MKKQVLESKDKIYLYELIEVKVPQGTIPLSIQAAIDDAEELLDVYSTLLSLRRITESALRVVEKEMQKRGHLPYDISYNLCF